MVHPILFCSLLLNTCKSVAVFEDAQVVPVSPSDKISQKLEIVVVIRKVMRYAVPDIIRTGGNCALVCSAHFTEILMS